MGEVVVGEVAVSTGATAVLDGAVCVSAVIVAECTVCVRCTMYSTIVYKVMPLKVL